MKSTMKVAIVVQDLNFMGGAERVAVNLANYLAESLDVTVVTFMDIEERALAFDLSHTVNIISLGCKNFNNHRNLFDRLLYKHRNWNLLKEYLIAKKIDVVIANNIFPNISALKKFNGASIMEIQHMCYEETALEKLRLGKYIFSPTKIWWFFRYHKYIHLRNKIYKKLKNVIVLTEREKERFKESGVENTVFIPNAINLFNFSAPLSHIREKNIIAVGRFVYQKGYDRLVRIITPVLKNNPQWTLTIYGAGPEKDNITNLIKSYGVENSLLLKDPTKNIMEKFLKSEIYLMTSRYEGFGMVLLEALSCGLPVISFDIHSGPKEIISDQIDGFLVEDGDEETFRTKVVQLISNRELRLRMRQNAYENVKRYSWRRIGKQWDDLLRSLGKA